MGLHHQSYPPRVFVTREGFKLDRAWPWEDFGWKGTAVMWLLTMRGCLWVFSDLFLMPSFFSGLLYGMHI